jgi:hypothetical protein
MVMFEESGRSRKTTLQSNRLARFFLSMHVLEQLDAQLQVRIPTFLSFWRHDHVELYTKQQKW